VKHENAAIVFGMTAAQTMKRLFAMKKKNLLTGHIAVGFGSNLMRERKNK
jgi:hypothetical protein